jgi:hypothetical protein
MLLLAETSRKGMPSSSARAWPCSVDTARFSSQSHLLPMRILLTPSVACCSTLENHVRMSSGLSVVYYFCCAHACVFHVGHVLSKLLGSVTS